MPDNPPAVSWRDVSVRYPYQVEDAVGPATLDVRPGERLLLLGPSGSGKSTLLATLTGLVPHSIAADVTGSVALFGHDVQSRTPAGWAASVAQLFQNPEQTLCGMTVGDEVAFALENQALPEQEIVARVHAALDASGFPAAERDRRTMTLSGGEKQLVALAATMAQDAPLLVVDEPTAHLAPAAATRLQSLIARDAAARAVLIVDHRLDGLLGMIDRVALVGANGQVTDGGKPRTFFRRQGEMLSSLGIWVPLASALDIALVQAGVVLGTPPLAIDEVIAGLNALSNDERVAAVEVARTFAASHVAPRHVALPGSGIVAELHDASCAPLFGPVVLRDVSLAIRAGETLAILGRNGAGKSTLGASLAGLLRLKQGRRSGPAGGLSFQNPESQFLAGSVRDEIALALGHGGNSRERAKQAGDVLAAWDLAELAARHPFELSHGQKRRLSLASLTAGWRWPLLVLDEPTAGLDAAGKSALEGQVGRLAGEGRAVAIITHDLDFALRTCSRAVIIDDGGIVADGPSVELLRDNALLERAGLEEPALATLLSWLDRQGSC